MLLAVDIENKTAERVRGVRLADFGLDERAFQHILFQSLDRLIPDNELLLLMESRRGPEEPDLMALDKDGRLYIFELKAWESHSENLLQVLRYGQIFGGYSYDDLERLYHKHERSDKTLSHDHASLFEMKLDPSRFNHAQTFVVMTNGIDFKTREAIRYWKQQGLDVRPWIYRVYKGDSDSMLLEVSSFSVEDNPYEDISEGYYILNTNYGNDPDDHDDMLKEKKAAAYFSPWKLNIERLSRGDVVFLYQSGVGVVAVGIASGKVNKSPYHGNLEHPDEEYSMPLTSFHALNKPIPAAEVKAITGTNYFFGRTMFGIDSDGGKMLYHEALKR